MSRYILGIDNGLTATKAAIYDLAGQEIGTRGESTPVTDDTLGRSEIDMADLWQVTARLIRRAITETGIDPANIIAIGNSGHGNGVYPVGRDYQPVRQAITSMDHRAVDTVTGLGSETLEELRSLSLQNVWEGQPGVLLRWIKEHEPSLYAKVDQALFCKDWIRLCLTGEATADYTDSSSGGLLNNRTKDYDPTILELLGIEEMIDALPEICASSAICGKVTEATAGETGLVAGTPVVGGMFDVDACALGSGLTRPGEFSMIAGTWNICSALGTVPFAPSHIRQCTVFADDRYYLSIASSATSASNLEWFVRQVLGGQCSVKDIERILSGYSPRASDVFFLPLLYGGLHDGDPGGMFFGLKASHTRDDLILAIAEGIVFAHRLHLDELRLDGLAGDTIRLSGGASRNKPWSRMFADITGRRVLIPESTQSGILGACIVAGIGAGAFTDTEDAVEKMVHIADTIEPNPETTTAAEDRYREFCSLLELVEQRNARRARDGR